MVILEYLCEAVLQDALPKDLFERANVRRWVCYIADNLISLLYVTLNQLKQEKIPEALATFLKLQENWSFLVENSLLKAGNKFLFGNQLTLGDYAAVPFLLHESIILSSFLQKDFFEFADNEKIQENLTVLKGYLRNVKDNTASSSVNYKLKTLPLLEKAPTLKELGVDSIEKFDYEKFLLQVFRKKFLSKI